MRAYWMGVFAATLLATPATGQMSLEDVMGNAVSNPDDTYENRQRRDNFNRDFTNQLLDNLTTGQPQNYEDTYERYYGDESGYRDPDPDPYYQDPYYDDGYAGSSGTYSSPPSTHGRAYDDVYAEPSNQRWRDDVANSPAARRHQAYERARDGNQHQPLSANRPDEAWRAVHGAQPYGNKDFARRRFDDLEDYEISEDDLQAAGDKTGMIDVNKIPDRAPPPRTPSSNWSFDDLDKMGPCCPDGAGWLTVYSFCQYSAWDDRNGNGRIEAGEQSINLYHEGRRETPDGECKVGQLVENR